MCIASRCRQRRSGACFLTLPSGVQSHRPLSDRSIRIRTRIQYIKALPNSLRHPSVFSHPSPPSLFHLFHPRSPSRATSSKWAPSSSRPPPAAQTPRRSPPTSTACYISSVSLASTRTSCRSSPPPWSASTPRRIRSSSPITRTRYTRTSRSVFSRRPPPRTPLFPHSSCTSTPPIQPSRTARVSPPPPPRAHGSPSIRRRVFSHSPSLNSRRLFFTSALLHLSRTTRISHLPVHAPQADTSPFMPILFAHACAPINLPRRRHFV